MSPLAELGLIWHAKRIGLRPKSWYYRKSHYLNKSTYLTARFFFVLAALTFETK